jgi:hypothetical protein
MTSARHYCPFDPTMAEYVIGALAAGRSLASVCTGQGIPSRATVMHWVAFEPGFEARYRRAREVGMEAVADSLMAWSRRGIDEDLRFVTREVSLADVTQARRTRIAVRQWLMARWAPDTFASRAASREERTETFAVASEAAQRPARDPDAPPRLSPRPFTIPPIAVERPIATSELHRPLDIEALHAAVITGEGDPPDDNVIALPAPPSAAPRPPRRIRRAMAAIARKRPLPDAHPPPA